MQIGSEFCPARIPPRFTSSRCLAECPGTASGGRLRFHPDCSDLGRCDSGWTDVICQQRYIQYITLPDVGGAPLVQFEQGVFARNANRPG